ncbi:MAG: hypothetical protein K0S56_2656, partial [Microvirga sp.]|nr:hypothetical protein [Microvirga sp.]
MISDDAGPAEAAVGTLDTEGRTGPPVPMNTTGGLFPEDTAPEPAHAESASSGGEVPSVTTSGAAKSSTMTTNANTTPEPAAGAVDDTSALLPDASYNGSYTTSIPIAVPGFRGLEPKLRLVYDSGRGLRAGGPLAGFLGTGWSLDGISSIVRVSIGRGTPRFDDTDVFLLDGEEIVPCPKPSKAPSCASGGNRMSKVESYRRFAYSGSAKRWRVTARDGTVYIYQASGLVNPNLSGDSNLKDRYLFVLTSATDRHGNVVKYSYHCTSGSVCYPTRITYNGTEIVLYRHKLSTPAMSIANGGESIGRVSGRLKTILVRTGGQKVRAYKLVHDLSALTGSARLSSVQEFGNNVVIDATGTVTLGARLPATTFAYSSSALGFRASGATIAAGHERLVLDLNGDQRSDVFGYTCVSTAEKCTFSYSTSPAQGAYASAWLPNIAYGHTVTGGDRWLSGDFIDQGRQQVMRIVSWADETCKPNTNECTTVTGTKAVLYRLDTIAGKTQLTATDWFSLPEGNLAGRAIAGDFEGSGTSKIFFDSTLLSTPSARYIVGTLPLCNTLRNYLVQTGDFDGDGRTDLLCHEADVISGTYAAILLWDKAGKRFKARERLLISGFQEPVTEFVVGDLNGDGKSDVTLLNKFLKTARVMLSNGKILVKGPMTALSSAAPGALVGDFDGDGRSDVYVPSAPNAAGGTILRYKGSAFVRRSLPDVSNVSP